MAPLTLLFPLSVLLCACLVSVCATLVDGVATNNGVVKTVYGGASSTLSNRTALLPSRTSAHSSTTATHPVHNFTSTGLAAPTFPSLPAPTVALDPDLAILASRRIDFAIAQQHDAASIPAWLASLGADGKWPAGEVDYTTGCPARRAMWPAQAHWVRLSTMAAAWHGGLRGADPMYVHDATLLAEIQSGMEWWFARDFTVDACLDEGGRTACPCGTPGLWNTNWFSNVIMIPRLVGQTCLLLNATLTAPQLGNCTHMTGRTYSTFFRGTPPGWLVGANVLDISSIGVAFGLITGNASTVADAYARVHQEVHVQEGFQVDGILADGSFGQHSGLLYNGNYGKDYSKDVMELEIEGAGTRFASAGDSRAAFESLMNASQWMIYQNTQTGVLHWDFSTEGRFISFPVADAQATGSININLTEVLELSTLWDSTVLRNVYAGLTTSTSTANVGPLLGNRMFWNSDYMVTRGKNYVSTLKMYSTRTRNSECLNSQNLLGFHLADGTTYTYIDGSEYEDISAAWDWNMIPGITVDYGGTPLACDTVNYSGLEDFVGGASTGGVGAAVMRYTNPVTMSLSFQKTWFYFAGDIQHVMVSILAATGPAPIFSVLDQRKSKGPIYVDGVPSSNGNFSLPRTLFHADTGYAFVNAPMLSISAGPRTGNWTAIGTSTRPPATVDLFAAWIAHGTGPPSSYVNKSAPVRGRQSNDVIEYTVFPGRTLQEFDAEAVASPLRTLRADSVVSAVQDCAHATTMMVFWQPAGDTVHVPATSAAEGGITVTVDSACVLILDQRAWTVTVADPTQLLGSVGITLSGTGPLPPGGPNQTLKISLPASPYAGSSVTQSLLS